SALAMLNASDDPALQLLKDLRRGRTSRPRVKGAGNKRSSRPGWQSDVRQFALLRDVWSPDANVLSVDYAGGDVQLNFSVSGQQLLSGCWTSNVLLNDQLLEHPLAWKCECWFSDRDADFVELTADLGEGIALMRQLLLARKESMLLVAEAIRGASPETRLTLRSSLPTVPDLRGEPDGLTRELQLTSEPIRLRVFPLHLPWERTVPGTGRLSAADAALECEVAGNQGVCQVVVLDWSDAGGERPADGTPLSVVEAGRPLSPGEACAGRVRIGQNHWFYLHNLTRGQIPRSVAGHHTDSETVIGKLDNEGDLHLLVHVEGDAGEEESEQVSGEKSE
ncbi:MAG: hypothetical protein KDA75_22125, partial [Planctomycetaceae bacterium]|nr:hypothetical protein [Planctomycetaceae bacterium]